MFHVGETKHTRLTKRSKTATASALNEGPQKKGPIGLYMSSELC